MELSWFDHEALFEQKIKLLNPDLASIEGEINYQACDDKLCIFRNEAFLFVLDKSKQVNREKKVIDTGSLEKISALKIDLKNKHFIDQNEQKKTDNSLQICKKLESPSPPYVTCCPFHVRKHRVFASYASCVLAGQDYSKAFENSEPLRFELPFEK